MPKGREIELKYIVPSEAELNRLISDARALHFPGLKAAWFYGPFNRNDTYYDTDDLALLRAGRCFRMGGKSARETRISFKEETGDPKERIEITDCLKAKDALAALDIAYPSAAMDALNEATGYRPVRPTLRVYKMLYAVTINTCEVVFGYVVYAGPNGAVERLDLEIEERYDKIPGVSETVGRVLAPRYNLKLNMRSKYRIGMELVGEKKK